MRRATLAPGPRRWTCFAVPKWTSLAVLDWTSLAVPTWTCLAVLGLLTARVGWTCLPVLRVDLIARPLTRLGQRGSTTPRWSSAGGASGRSMNPELR